MDDILSRKLLEANFEGKSVSVSTCTVSGKMKCMDTLIDIQFFSNTVALSTTSFAIVVVIIVLWYTDLLIKVSSQ